MLGWLFQRRPTMDEMRRQLQLDELMTEGRQVMRLARVVLEHFAQQGGIHSAGGSGFGEVAGKAAGALTEALMRGRNGTHEDEE